MPVDEGCGADFDGHAAPALLISCNFGLFEEQNQVNLKTHETQKLCEIALLRVPTPHFCVQYSSYPIFIDTALIAQFLPESSMHVFNTGASVWGLNWCPIHPNDRPHKNMLIYCATPIDILSQARFVI